MLDLPARLTRRAALVLALAVALSACGGTRHPGRSARHPDRSALDSSRSGRPPARSASRANPTAARGTAILTVETGRPGRTIPPGFVGLSFEYWNLPTYAGTNPAAIDPVFVALVRGLSPRSAPSVRIGGVSTDHTWYPIPGMAAPPWVQFTISRGWLALARSFARATGARLLLGVNFEAGSARIVGAEAKALVDGIGAGAIAGLELGNEPELYAGFPWYRISADVRVRGRRRSAWSPALAAQQYNSIARALGGTPVAGPAVGSPKWIGAISTFLSTNPELRLATIHAYPLKRCSSGAHVTIAQLLDRTSTEGLAAKEADAAVAARRAGIPIRVAEMNSVSCGGQPGVSDTFASALWSIDALFALARVGIDGVNFHTTPAVSNHLFTFRHLRGGWVGTVYPVYYGLEMFDRAAPAGSRIVQIRGATGPALRAWATHDAGGTTRIVLINTSGSRARAVTVRVADGTPTASVQRLTAPGLAATGTVTLDGQGFGGRTATGVMSGRRATETVDASGGAYTVTVAPASAALLTVRAR